MIGIYKITNTITNDCYIGSSKNVECRMSYHKYASVWKHYPTKMLYKAFQQYGLDNFTFETIETTSLEDRRSREQYWIERLQPAYNTISAYTDRKEYAKQYNKQYGKQYYIEHADYRKEYAKQYSKKYYIEHTDDKKEYLKQYNNQLCNYNGEVLTLCALRQRLRKMGIEHPTIEAKTYLVKLP